MKTLLLDLNRTLLVVEPNENGKLAVLNFSEYVVVNNLGTKTKLNIKTSEYDFVCLGGDLSEEKLIENEIILKGRNSYGELVYENHYPEIGAFMGLNAALDSFRSKIESLGWYWLENPECSDVTCSEAGDYAHWSSVKSRTFKNECLIFIKK